MYILSLFTFSTMSKHDCHKFQKDLFNAIYAAATAAKSLQSCPTLYNPIDCSPPGSAVPGIFQARTLEWDAFAFSNAIYRQP